MAASNSPNKQRKIQLTPLLENRLFRFTVLSFLSIFIFITTFITMNMYIPFHHHTACGCSLASLPTWISNDDQLAFETSISSFAIKGDIDILNNISLYYVFKTVNNKEPDITAFTQYYKNTNIQSPIKTTTESLGKLNENVTASVIAISPADNVGQNIVLKVAFPDEMPHVLPLLVQKGPLPKDPDAHHIIPIKHTFTSSEAINSTVLPDIKLHSFHWFDDTSISSSFYKTDPVSNSERIILSFLFNFKTSHVISMNHSFDDGATVTTK